MNLETENANYTSDQTVLNTEEKIASLFQPDTLLAAQYFENLRGKTILEPEKSLMLAVLEDAVECFQTNVSAQTAKRRGLFEEAQQWILEENTDWLFSFANICEVLEINPDYVRRGLQRWKEKKLAERAYAKDWEERKVVG